VNNIEFLVSRTKILKEVLGHDTASLTLLLEYLNEVETASIGELEVIYGSKVKKIVQSLVKFGLVTLDEKGRVTLTSTGRYVLKLLQEICKVLSKSILLCN